MPQVAIPAEHFTNNVKNNYSEHKSALIREFLQNSIDAGATRVDFIIEETDDNITLIVKDNGCGMTQDILVSALLTMSGSYKNEQSIGGFGAAKEILLFQHQSYRVITRQNGKCISVDGRQLEYEFTSHQRDEDGTTVIIEFHPHFNYEKYEFELIAVDYLGQCETSCDIYWNDNLITSTHKCSKLVRELEWANIYCEPVDNYSSFAFIRINGVLMFKEYVGSISQRVVVEITKPSTDILTVNRDRFTNKYSIELNKLIQEIAIDKNTFGKCYQQKIRWRGENRAFRANFKNKDIILGCPSRGFRSYSIEAPLTAISDRFEQLNLEGDRNTTTEEALNIARDVTGMFDMPEEIVDAIFREIEDAICDHYADFVIHVQGQGFDEIPKSFKPNSMSKRNCQLARLWKRCIKLVLQANHLKMSYTIGWVLDHDQSFEASYFISDDNVNVFLLNPCLEWTSKSTQSERFNRLLLLACHEISHVYNTWHDERFTQKMHDLLLNSLCFVGRKGNSWWKTYLESKEEVL